MKIEEIVIDDLDIIIDDSLLDEIDDGSVVDDIMFDEIDSNVNDNSSEDNIVDIDLKVELDDDIKPKRKRKSSSKKKKRKEKFEIIADDLL